MVVVMGCDYMIWLIVKLHTALLHQFYRILALLSHQGIEIHEQVNTRSAGISTECVIPENIHNPFAAEGFFWLEPHPSGNSILSF